MKRMLLILATFAALTAFAAAQTVFINEIHYDDASGDANEGVEIAGPAGTDLTGWTLVPYNGGTGASYTPVGAPTATISDQGGGFGTVWVPITGLQNGAPDGVALVNPSSVVVQFLSYEGTFTAVGGVANGMLSVDIGVAEAGSEVDGQALQLIGTGSVYTDFTWTGPVTATAGAVNAGQTFQPPVVGDDPDATFQPSTSLGFGIIDKATTKDVNVYVKNDAGSANNLDITGITFGGADPSFFSLVTSLPVSAIAPDTSATLTFRYNPAGVNGADHNATATLICNDPNPPTITLSGDTYLDVADLAAARAAALGATVRVTGTVVVNSPTSGLNTGGNRHQLFVQDSSGTDGQTGIFIDDAAYKLAADYDVGDQLQNLVGVLTDYNGWLELVASEAATFVGAGAAPAPLVLLGTETFNDIESELIRLDGVSITTGDATWMGTSPGVNYTLNLAVGPVSVIRVEEGSAIIGTPIVGGNFDIIGVAGEFNGTGQIFPRFAADYVTPPSNVPDWILMK